MKKIILYLIRLFARFFLPSGAVAMANTETVFTITNRAAIFGLSLSFARDNSTETISMVQHTVGPAYQPLPGSGLGNYKQAVGDLAEIERAQPKLFTAARTDEDGAMQFASLQSAVIQRLDSGDIDGAKQILATASTAVPTLAAAQAKMVACFP